MSQSLAFRSHEIRTVTENSEMWFAAKDVCSILGIRWNGQNTLSAIPDEWRRVWKYHTPPKGQQSLVFISEAGLYMLAFRSSKPEAITLTQWVASEVLPSIRKTGGYEVHTKQKALPNAQQIAPPAVTENPDANAKYADMREELRIITKLLQALNCQVRVWGPQSGLMSHHVLLDKIGKEIDRALEGLYAGSSRLDEANRLTSLLIQRGGHTISRM